MDGNYNYSLSDLATVTGENGFGGNNAWLIILFIFLFGGGGLWGNRANAAGEAASTESIISSQRFDSVSKQINAIGDGIASATFSLNNSVKDGNAAVSAAVISEGRSLQSQIADASCANQRNVDALRFDMSNYAAQINSNIDAKFAAIEKSQLESRLAEQAQQISQLQLSQAVCGIPRVSNAAWGVYPYAAAPPCNCGTI